MYANVRQYRIAADMIDETMRLADTELADRLAEEPGFVAYELMATEDGSVCSMTIFEDREGTERSQEVAAEFVREPPVGHPDRAHRRHDGRSHGQQGARAGAAARAPLTSASGGRRRARTAPSRWAARSNDSLVAIQRAAPEGLGSA